MSFGSNWSQRDKAKQDAQKFLRTGKVANTGPGSSRGGGSPGSGKGASVRSGAGVIFSNVTSKRVGCVDSSGCASGWRCNGGYCIEPQNTPGSRNNNSVNDQGCGSNNIGDPGGGGGECAASTGDSGGSGRCVKSGCGGASGFVPGNNTGQDDCCGESRCCRFDRFGVRCQCGNCPPDTECDEFCAVYAQANGDSAPGCEKRGCDECSTCEFYAFQGVKNLYRCEPKQFGAPCYCDQEGESSCDACEECTESGVCRGDFEDCYPAFPPKPEPPSGGGPCVSSVVTNTICTEPGGPQTSAGTCLAGGGVVKGAWVAEDGFECVLCEYREEAGDCGPEPCDCNCENDCGDCEICDATGKCVPDPRCEEQYFTEYAWINQEKGIAYTQQSGCNAAVNNYNGAKSVFFSQNGNLATDSPSLFWTYTSPSAPPSSFCEGSFCSTGAAIVRDGLVYGAQGSVGPGGTAPVDYVACRGSDGWEQLYSGTGIIVGFGETQAEAIASAQAQLSA